MKLFAAILSLAACTLAQRLHIAQPSAGATLHGGEFFTLSLTQDQSLGALQQVAITVSATPCYDVCGAPAQWGPGTVLYSGKFHPRANASAPQAGHAQDFRVQMPSFGAATGVALAVAHQFKAGGATLVDVFEYYTDVMVTVQ
ncbi:hypothetical protein PsYK624_150370 [Phanerochaete sordida]|uniref:Uncharacterized protein n=1 Tax=Phanerochaete sordida TaxID=48140 RepID=A0A9P3LKX3_9APHY|nr:hypothetical protein PsYK624_150370 [Phanerochaete sordida]